MIEIIPISQAQRWDEIVRTFSKHDVYYLSGYVKAFQKHGDGNPELFYYNENGIRGLYVYMKRPTVYENWFDACTPYGYGGILIDAKEANISDEKLCDLFLNYAKKMKESNVISNFVRYHPILSNAISINNFAEVTYLGKTVAMDLSSPNVIWENLTSKNRNMIRKAKKNGIVIKHGQGMDLMDDFIKIYNATMEKDHAEEYYFFGREFYESIHNDLRENYEMFWAEYEGKKIAMSIMIFANGYMNYHLSGSDIEYRNLAPSNLLLYQAALWGCEKGLKTFHLGGGVGSGEDNLYKFKAAFNRNSDYQFSIAKMIFDQDKYDALVAERASRDADFNKDSHFFPLYRS